uniref:Sepiapterin reductase n=1 Tax=Caligus clemensi TaxID=344056 RepID=C1C1B7_CALCM|nr:Sepiapterin reductase [Caligus clemensi]
MKCDKKFLMVTGASKGFGQSIALEWAKFCAVDSKIIITARSEKGLKETESGIKKINSGIHVVKFVADHSNPVKVAYDALFSKEIEGPGDRFDFGMIVHNVGVVEPQGEHALTYSDLEEMEKYFRLNLFSVMILNATFSRVKEYLSNPLFIVNVSSIGALSPIPTWGYYCMGKAARKMYFGTLAVEEGKSVRVLNYSPGVMNTSAVDRITNSDKTTEDIKDFCCENVIQPSDSAKKLALIISKNSFQSGTQIDFADEV